MMIMAAVESTVTARSWKMLNTRQVGAHQPEQIGAGAGAAKFLRLVSLICTARSLGQGVVVDAQLRRKWSGFRRLTPIAHGHRAGRRRAPGSGLLKLLAAAVLRERGEQSVSKKTRSVTGNNYVLRVTVAGYHRGGKRLECVACHPRTPKERFKDEE